MSETNYQGRRAVQLENDRLRVTLLIEGGHIAEILDKASGVNPLWTPPWKSIEPSTYDKAKHPEYGGDAESQLLAGLMGHNLCLDVFGGPSEEEAAAGLTVHGEASLLPYQMSVEGGVLTARLHMAISQLQLERQVRLDGDRVLIRETVENLTALDRPIAWTQHVTLGPPYLKHGVTQFRAPGTKSKTYESEFGASYRMAAEFDWPFAPLRNGGTLDLRVYPNSPSSAGYTAHMLDPHRPEVFFLAWSPESKVLFGYRWKRSDFPWLGIWEENRWRKNAPWNGRTVTRGMEFGASPMPETRRRMIERGSMFGVPGYRWLTARGKAVVEYSAFARTADSIPDEP